MERKAGSMTIRVVVNEQGEAVEPSVDPYKHPDPVSWESEIDLMMLHAVCRCTVGRQSITKDLDVLHCTRCGLRVAIPNHIRTWEQLRTYFRELQ